MNTHTDIKKKVLNEKGSTLIGVSFIIFFIGILGMAAIELTTEEATASGNQVITAQALYVGQAGLEYAQRRLDLGLDPEVADFSVANGNFTVTANPSQSTTTVVSSVGDASKTQTITTNFSKDCATIDASSASINGKNIEGLQIEKTCNQYATISKMWISWNWDACVTGSVYDPVTNDLSWCSVDDQNASVKHVGIEGTAIYNPGNGIGSPGGGGASAGEEIDVVDFTLSTNQAYQFDGPPQPIRLSKNIPANGLYTIVILFSDNSQATATFQL